GPAGERPRGADAARLRLRHRPGGGGGAVGRAAVRRPAPAGDGGCVAHPLPSPRLRGEGASRPEAGEVVGEVGESSVVETAYRLGHSRLGADAGARPIVLERPEEVAFALAGEARHLLASREVGVVAASANALPGDLGAALVAGPVDRALGRRGR